VSHTRMTPGNYRQSASCTKGWSLKRFFITSINSHTTLLHAQFRHQNEVNFINIENSKTKLRKYRFHFLTWCLLAWSRQMDKSGTLHSWHLCYLFSTSHWKMWMNHSQSYSLTRGRSLFQEAVNTRLVTGPLDYCWIWKVQK
jgi:hypothetical protein